MRIVIMRFGPPTPIKAINDALLPHFQNDPKAVMLPTPGGVMSVFNTDSTPEEVAASLKEVSSDLPFFVMPLNSECMQIPGLFEHFGENVPNEPQTSTLSVDEVLEKISATGLESLTEDERALLEGRA